MKTEEALQLAKELILDLEQKPTVDQNTKSLQHSKTMDSIFRQRDYVLHMMLLEDL